MLHIKDENKTSKRLRSIIYTIFNRLENNNNAVFSSNGEESFLDSYLSDNVKVVFDVGANIGEYSGLLLKKSKALGKDIELHIFEPLSVCFKKIENEFSNEKKVFANNFGVSDNETSTEIYFDVEGSSFASLYQRDLQSLNKELNKKEKNISGIDLLKIDVEGHEVSVLKGIGKFLSPDFINVIQFEYGGANLDSRTYLKDLYAILKNKGYIVCKIMKNGIQPREYESKMENFQYANYLAINPALIND